MQPSVFQRYNPACSAWTPRAVTEQEMHAIAQGPLEAVEAARVVLFFLAVVVVAFWRVILRLVLALIAIAILVAVGSGVVALMNAGHL